MNLKDFFFSYNQVIKADIKKKKYFKAFRKIFNYPYKFILNKLRETFLLKKINLSKKKDDKILKNMDFDELFKNFNSDKASKFMINNQVIDGHNYSPFYEKYFQKFKNKENLNILEIGSLRGAATASFYYYFNKPLITCVDINPFQIQIFSKNIRSIYIDTQSNEVLNNLCNYLNQEFDIIIDDGSHNVRDQIISLNVFFKKIKKNGIYVIEDSSQYLSAPHLNPDNLSYGSKEIILSIKNNQFEKVKYLSNNEVDILNKSIKNVFLEKGNYIQNKINISEIIFIEKD
ncbi:class I SAM-dependent methyltransferase [Pelagibacterales bacterium SAG-MED19]|nr:class I SAM-dependent methyltransferase [Pelagibacterales bacterium SAG-MED19]